VNSVIGKALSSTFAGSHAFAASLSPPSSVEKTTTLPFFGMAIRAKLIVGLGVIEYPCSEESVQLQARSWWFSGL
jgi:hypothetical protein